MIENEIKKTEHRIQQEVVKSIRNRFCLAHHNPRWAIFSIPNDGKSMKEQIRKIATGLMSGVSDLLFIMPGRVIFVEIKAPGGVQSKEQIEFQRIVEALGFEYCIVRSVEEFYDKIIPEYKPVV